MPIVHLIGATSTLEELFSLPFISSHSEKCKETYSHPQVRVFRKRFTLYTPTALPTREWKQEGGEGRWRMEKDKSFSSRKLNSLLIGRVLSRMNHDPEVSDEELEQYLYELVPSLCIENDIAPPVTGYDIATGNADRRSMTWDQAIRTIRSAVAYAREMWDPKFYPALQQRAREAGRKGKKYDLAAHLATAHLNVTAAARALGLSRPTVYAMRREFADIDPTTGELRGEEETTSTPDDDESVVADRVRSEAGDEPRLHADELAPAFSHRGSGSHSHAPLAPGMDDEAGGILHELDGMPLPF